MHWFLRGAIAVGVAIGVGVFLVDVLWRRLLEASPEARMLWGDDDAGTLVMVRGLPPLICLTFTYSLLGKSLWRDRSADTRCPWCGRVLRRAAPHPFVDGLVLLGGACLAAALCMAGVSLVLAPLGRALNLEGSARTAYTAVAFVIAMACGGAGFCYWFRFRLRCEQRREDRVHEEPWAACPQCSAEGRSDAPSQQIEEVSKRRPADPGSPTEAG